MRAKASQTKRMTILAIALFLAAGLLHEIDRMLPPAWSALAFLLNLSIYIGLALGWAISIQRRIMPSRIRRLLIAAALLTVLWLFLRACKYRFFNYEPIRTYLWYLYYLPQLLAPTLTLLIALEQGHSPENPLRRRWYLLLIPALLLFLGVLTNEWHQLAFRFPPVYVRREDSYTHGPIYFLAMLWSLGMIAASMAILFRKCRVDSSRRHIWLPGALFVLGFGLCLLSFADILSAFKVPEMFCATFAATFECCIQIGLIPSNTNYGSYFSASTISAQIADESDEIVFSSEGARTLTPEQRRRAQDGDAFLDADTRLHCHPLRGGRLYWTDSVAQINRVRRQLTEVGELLTEDNELVRAENALQHQQARLEEQNRLYDGMLPTVRTQLARIDALLDGLEPDAADFGQRIAQVCVYGAYVKRRCNLSLIQEAGSSVPAQELALCIRESLGHLAELQVATSLRLFGDAALLPAQIILAYDFFEAAIEAALPSLSALLVNLIAEADGLTLRMSMEDVRCALPTDWEAARMAQLHGALRLERQDQTLFAALRIRRAGEAA